MDSEGKEQPWDGKTYGDLMVRGPWILESYYKGSSPLVKDEQGLGWLPTGDVATIDEDGFMQITDRTKDVIKSGGEWISSIDIENIAMGHPAVAMAAVHRHAPPQVDERPIVAVSAQTRARRSRARHCWRFTRARRPNGRFRTTWCSWTPFRWVRQARCSRPSCVSSSRITVCHRWW